MSYPSIIYGAPESMPYLTYSNPTVQSFAAQKGPYPLGTQIVLQDGRKFRFAMNGATLLVVGNVIQAAVPISTDEDLTCAAGAIGDRQISYTHGADVTVVNYFSEGFAVISVDPGGGDTYKILEHIALTSGGTAEPMKLAPGNALRTALTTVSRLDLTPNPFAWVVQVPITTQTSIPVGVAISAIPATDNVTAGTTGAGWLQTFGPCGVLTGGTVIIGNRAVSPGTAAGCCGPETAVVTNQNIEVTIGFVEKVTATAGWSTINLRLDS